MYLPGNDADLADFIDHCETFFRDYLRIQELGLQPKERS